MLYEHLEKPAQIRMEFLKIDMVSHNSETKN